MWTNALEYQEWKKKKEIHMGACLSSSLVDISASIWCWKSLQVRFGEKKREGKYYPFFFS